MEKQCARSLVAVDCGINLKPTVSVAQQDIHREKKFNEQKIEHKKLLWLILPFKRKSGITCH